MRGKKKNASTHNLLILIYLFLTLDVVTPGPALLTAHLAQKCESDGFIFSRRVQEANKWSQKVEHLLL